MKAIVIRFILIQLLLGAADAWSGGLADSNNANVADPVAATTKVTAPSLVTPAQLPNNEVLPKPPQHKVQQQTRPVYHPKPQKIVAVNFDDEDSLEPQKLVPRYESFAALVGSSAQNRAKAQAAQISVGTPDEELNSDKDFGTANEGKNLRTIASSDNKVEDRNKSVNINKALKIFRRESARELKSEY